MKRLIMGLTLGFVAAGLLSTRAAAVEIVANGDFEMNPPDTGWSIVGIPLFGDWSGLFSTATTNTVWFGGYSNADDEIFQNVDLGALPGTATLSFDLAIYSDDWDGFDFLDVYLGGNLLDSIDLGDPGYTGTPTLSSKMPYSYDVSAMVGLGVQELRFVGTTDSSFDCSAFLDNVSIDVSAVPEPSSIAVLALGALTLIRRRR